jgi:hypothetical protein
MLLGIKSLLQKDYKNIVAYNSLYGPILKSDPASIEERRTRIWKNLKNVITIVLNTIER